MKIGRNDPCPCGSGKKFKKCCLNKKQKEQQLTDRPSPLNRKSGDYEHRELENYSKIRLAELSKIFTEEVEILIGYEQLICMATTLLGQIPPKDVVDKSIRDLLADIFDFLYNARKRILEGCTTIAFPLLRRAYECICLIQYFMLRPEKASVWDKGKEITNSEVRNYLDSHPMGESKANLKEFYTFFSKGTHPNRGFIPFRYLGEENRFVLGSIGVPDILIVANYLQKMFKLWFWYGALISYHYREAFQVKNVEYILTYRKVSDKAQKVFKKLCEGMNKLLDERNNKK